MNNVFHETINALRLKVAESRGNIYVTTHDSMSGLSVEQQQHLVAELAEYYNRIESHLSERCFSWTDLAEIVEMCSTASSRRPDFCLMPSLHPIGTRVFEYKVGCFWNEVKAVFRSKKNLESVLSAFEFSEDTVLLSNEELTSWIRLKSHEIDRAAVNVAGDRFDPAFDKVEYLSRVRQSVVDRAYESERGIFARFELSHFVWQFDFSTDGFIRAVPRDTNLIGNWIDAYMADIKAQEVMEIMATPRLRLPINTPHHKQMRDWFLRNGIAQDGLIRNDVGETLSERDVDLLLETRFYFEGEQLKRPMGRPIYLIPRTTVKPVQIIRSLLASINPRLIEGQKIQSALSDINSDKAVADWIVHLFSKYQMRGFSESHVKKVRKEMQEKIMTANPITQNATWKNN